MNRKEIGRLSVGDIALIEYDNFDEPYFYIQAGITGFYVTPDDLTDLHGILNYYFNIETISNVVLSLTDGGDDNDSLDS